MSNFEISGPWKVFRASATELEQTLNTIENEGEQQVVQMVPPMGDNNEWTILTRQAPRQLDAGTLPPEVEARLREMQEMAESTTDA